MRKLTVKSRGAWLACAILPVLAMIACTKPVAKTPAAPPPPVGDLDFSGAVQQVANDLAQQLGTAGGARELVVDPLLDRVTGQQTAASARVEAEMKPALTKAVKGLTILPFDQAGTEKARFLLTGTLGVVESPDRYVLSVAFTDRRSGLVIAQSAVRFRQAALDTAPTPFYSDSPAIGRDRSVEGYLRTAETTAGKPADALYVEQLTTSAVLSEALEAYNASRWQDALTRYTAAASRTDGQQLRTFNGLYLTNLRLGRMREAEDAFGRVAALGLATNNLAVKMLFRPGSSAQFWPGPQFAEVYPMWLRQIARATQTAGSCLNIVGHTSRSGSEAVNDKLSVARAEAVRRLLETEVKTLTGRLRASGVGFAQNIIGSGSDDASDAVDRRVEFKVVPCGG